MQTKLRSLHQSQFLALLQKDFIQQLQGGKVLLFLRFLVPIVSLLILYVIQHSKTYQPFSGIPKSYHISDLSLPKCVVVADAESNVGFGSKLPNIPCTTLSYYPKNEFTTKIMEQAAINSGLKPKNDLIGFNSKEEYEAESQRQMLFFNVIFESQDYANLNNLSILLQFNQTYFDNPALSHIFKWEQLSAEINENWMVFPLVTHTTLPLTLELKIQQAILEQNDIDFDPLIRSVPFRSNTGRYQPFSMLTVVITLLNPLIQFAVVLLKILQDKQQGHLTALRLVGMQDFIYILENLLFQILMFLLTCFVCLITMYALPGTNDMFPFVNVVELVQILLMAGVQSTCYGIFLGCILPGKATFLAPILVIGLALVSLILESMVGAYAFYNDLFPSGFLRFLLRIIVPFAHMTMSTSQFFSFYRPKTYFNELTFDYKLLKKETNISAFYDQVKFTSLSKVVTVAPGIATLLVYEGLLSVLYIFGGWILSEFIPGDGGAQRPFWKLFKSSYFSSLNYGFTQNSFKNQRQKQIGKLLNNDLQRRPLTWEVVDKLQREVQGKSSDESKSMSKLIMTKPNNQKNVLVTHHLHRTFKRPRTQRILLGPDHVAVKSVSIEVQEGEIYGLVGHNGAGKSTTLQMITGAIKPNKQGARLFQLEKQTKNLVNNCWICNEYDIRDDITQVRRRIGYCPQFNTNVFSYLTIDQNIRFYLKFTAFPVQLHDRIVTQILKSMNLFSWRYKLLSQLSGGMQRRISIAMTMLNPQLKLIILDEPTTGLDPQTKRLIWSIIKSKAREEQKCPIITGSSHENCRLGYTRLPPPGLILTSHDMNEVNSLSDEIGIMADGQIVASGTALKLKRQFGGGFTLTVNCQSRIDAEKFQQVSNLSLSLVDFSGQSLIYSVPQDDKIIVQVLKTLTKFKEAGYLIDDFTMEQSSLDEVFMKVGQIFDIENGADRSLKKVDPSLPKFETTDIQGGLQDQGANDMIPEVEIEYSERSLESEKTEAGQLKHQQSKSTSRFQNEAVVLRKMWYNDQMRCGGWLSYFVVPVIFLLISYLLTDQLVPYVATTLKVQIDEELASIGIAGDYCDVLKAAAIPIPDCDGYDRWGQPGMKNIVKLFQSQLYQPPPVWVGGFSQQQGIYGTHEAQYPVYIFDNENVLGADRFQDNTNKLLTAAGNKKTFKYSVGNFVSMSSSEFRFYENNTPAVLVSQQSSIKNNVLENMPQNTIAVQKISKKGNTSTPQNSFDVYQDLKFLSGYDKYENLNSIDEQNFRLMQSRVSLPLSLQWHEENLSAEQNYQKYSKWAKMFMNDTLSQQKFKQYLVQKINHLYLETDNKYLSDKSKESNLTHKFGMKIIGAVPTNYRGYPISGYRLDAELIKDQQFNQTEQFIQSQGIDTDNVFDLGQQLKLAPTLQISVIDGSFYQEATVFAFNNIVDLSARMTNALLRTYTSQPANISFGLQQFEYSYSQPVGTLTGILSIQLGSIFIGIAGLIGMVKFGQHIVLDRQTNMRRQLYLNGVSAGQYWAGVLVYSFSVNFIIYLIIYVVAQYVFRISLFQRIESTMLIIISLLGVLSSTATSLFFGAIYTRTIAFTLTMLVIIIFSVVYSIFLLGILEVNVFAYILPTIGQITLITDLANFGYSPSEFFASVDMPIFVWMIVESVILLIAAFFIDSKAPINGFQPQQRKIKDHKWPPRARVELNNIPNDIEIRTVRDAACCHGLDRIDSDVLQERTALLDIDKSKVPIVIENIQKTFNKFLAIRDISFHIPYNANGQVFSLLGPNGAAKTTLINILLKLQSQTKGKIYLLGKDMDTDAEEVYRNIGLCSQFDVYLPNLTVREHLIIFALVHGVQKNEVNQVVARLSKFVQIDGVLDKVVGQLSGGMKRRMSLALAMVE